jgi:translation initiation factor 2 gamma subunit (eIF-2gamma)
MGPIGYKYNGPSHDLKIICNKQNSTVSQRPEEQQYNESVTRRTSSAIVAETQIIPTSAKHTTNQYVIVAELEVPIKTLHLNKKLQLYQY